VLNSPHTYGKMFHLTLNMYTHYLVNTSGCVVVCYQRRDWSVMASLDNMY